VLTLTLRDLPRAASLFASLAHQLRCGHSDGDSAASEPCWLTELVVVVPDGEAAGIEALLGDRAGTVRVVQETSLLFGSAHAISSAPQNMASWDTYAVAMSLKLLVANIVRSDFYVTLDADVLVTKRFGPRDLFSFGIGAPRALFVAEPQSVHPHWWAGAAATLDPLKGGALESSSFDSSLDASARFGVTPAVLSTGGALLNLAKLKEVFHQPGEDASKAWVGRWLSAWGGGRWWSEYTLYALTLHRHRIFDQLHAPTSSLTCHSAWFASDLPWDAALAFRSNNCFFAVVQSSSGADPSELAAAVAKELGLLTRNSTRELLTLASIFRQPGESSEVGAV
jgi:hypothetical protein